MGTTMFKRCPFLSMVGLALAGCQATGAERPEAAAPPSSRAGGFLPAPAARPRVGISLDIGKCINMGNHLDTADGRDWGRAIVPADFTIIREAGFGTVRIPVRWSAHALAKPPYTIDAQWMAKVRAIVDAAGAAGLNVILNMHHYDELYRRPAEQGSRFAAMWRQIGQRFADAPATVWFELINEPREALDDTSLPAVLASALANLRTSNPTRPVIIGGQYTSTVDSLSTLELPDDPFVVPTFHTYEPMNFTHQGANWIKPTPPVGRQFGNLQDRAELESNLRKVSDYMARTGRVPFIGEYGVTDIKRVRLTERIDYIATISAAYASIGVQSCIWAYTNTFQLRKGDAWLPGIVEAIRTTEVP